MKLRLVSVCFTLAMVCAPLAPTAGQSLSAKVPEPWLLTSVDRPMKQLALESTAADSLQNQETPPSAVRFHRAPGTTILAGVVFTSFAAVVLLVLLSHPSQGRTL